MDPVSAAPNFNVMLSLCLKLKTPIFVLDGHFKLLGYLFESTVKPCSEFILFRARLIFVLCFGLTREHKGRNKTTLFVPQLKGSLNELTSKPTICSPKIV